VAQQVNFTRIDEAVVTRASEVLDLICRQGLSVVTAESCTGGLIAAVLSEAPGANEQPARRVCGLYQAKQDGGTRRTGGGAGA
jgi:hypothetical protein